MDPQNHRKPFTEFKKQSNNTYMSGKKANVFTYFIVNNTYFCWVYMYVNTGVIRLQ